jgi:uncharacterized protein YjbI with pentapeptide repeats
MIKITVIVVSALVLGFSGPVASYSASAAARENLQILLETRTCQNCDLSGLDLNRLDLSDVDLQGADLSLSSCKLTNLSGANLSKAKLNGVAFDGADLGEADLRGADLRGARLDSAYLEGVKTSGKIIEQEELDNDGNVLGSRDVVKEDIAKSKRRPVAGQADLTPSHLDSGVPALQSSQVKSTQDMAQTGEAVPVKSPIVAPVAAIVVAPEEKKIKMPFSQEEPEVVSAKPLLIRAIQKKVKVFSDGVDLSESGKLTIHAEKKKKFAEIPAGSDDSTESSQKMSQDNTSELSVAPVNSPPVNSPVAFTGSAAPKAKSLRAVREVPEVKDVAAEKETVKTAVPLIQQRTNSVKEMTASPAAQKVLALPEGVEAVEKADKAENLPGSDKLSSKKKAQLEMLKHDNKCYACDLAGIDFSGENLENVDLEGADLSGCDFSKANLEGANLKAVNLRGASLRDANLRGVDFYKADLAGADLSGSKVKDASFDGASLQGTLGLKKKEEE